MNIADPTLCEWSTTNFLIFSENVWGDFIYYSHIFPAVTVLVIATFVFWQNPKGKVNRALLFLASIFAIWSYIDLVLWATERSDLIMFFWSILIYFDLLIYVGAFYFIYAFIKKERPKLWQEIILASLFIPLILFSHTSLNLTAFDFTNCWREALEGPLWQYYVYYAEIVIAFAIVIFSIVQFRQQRDVVLKKEIIFATVGIFAFLFSFSLGNIAGSIETDWEFGQYGLFGMPVFVIFLTYLIVKYKSFASKLIATQALVVGLGILILSLSFVQKVKNVQIIALITFILTIIIGVILIRSVKREIEQKEQIEQLAKGLELANDRLKTLDKMKSEFVSIASHQLRSPLTSIRGYSSMLIEGSFGILPQKAKEAIERINESSRFMASSVEDYLNVSRIQAGNMKYEYSDFNLRDVAMRTADDTRQIALKKGLLLTFKSDLTKQGIVHADIGKTRQVIDNLINNSLKYTPKGSITVTVRDDVKLKKISVEISDTGIGMAPHTLENIFGKFERASNANEVNVTGTGLGLYIARKMAREMGGDVTAFSEGENKGSTFRIELPLMM